MSYNNNKSNQESNDVGRLSLWENFDPNKKHIMSGTVTIEDEEFVVYIYENANPKNDNSPQFFGFIKEKKQQAPKSRFGNSKKQAPSDKPKKAERDYSEYSEGDAEF